MAYALFAKPQLFIFRRARGVGCLGAPPVVGLASFLVCIRLAVVSAIRMFVRIGRIFVHKFISAVIERSWWLAIVAIFIALI